MEKFSVEKWTPVNDLYIIIHPVLESEKPRHGRRIAIQAFKHRIKFGTHFVQGINRTSGKRMCAQLDQNGGGAFWYP